ncbi:hypothetical protein Patl1_06656 [Pistacia atlantica]|uniref:Uncharacterized protein n=1 Tax=Pistacia atlantica TaxID=434234 RepID=A0ACC1BVI3_9ROSI|nr:hypothetical protein Patl1_06656 [Pistacia atlantica]
MAQNDTAFNSFFSSLIQDIKALLRHRSSSPLAPKCTQTFESERRYKNDMRYLRVWLELMDYVDDPRGLLRTMEANRIGTKRSLFYQAYALYYEKMKKFEEAEKMYHLGVQNFAEPADELQKSFEQFLHRMERHKKKRIRMSSSKRNGELRGGLCLIRSTLAHSTETGENSENIGRVEGSLPETLPENRNAETKKILKESSQNAKQSRESNHDRVSEKLGNIGLGDDTVVVKFVDKAIVGKSETEDACHHGLVDPTINMKEAMNAINNMFREPLDTSSTWKKITQKPEERGSGFGKWFYGVCR